MIQILTAISPLFLIIFASALLQKFKNVGKNWGKILNEFALNIGFPVLIFTALAKTSFSFKTEATMSNPDAEHTGYHALLITIKKT